MSQYMIVIAAHSFVSSAHRPADDDSFLPELSDSIYLLQILRGSTGLWGHPSFLILTGAL